MSSFVDLVGKKFSRLLVLGQADTVFSPAGNPRSRWLCKCDCGNEVTVDTTKLNNSHTKSCGCLYKESRKTCAVTHGMRSTRSYRTYAGMKSRCNNPKDSNFRLYGGRGVSVCKEWEADFLNFFADMGARPEGKSLDRVDNSQGYSKGNCRWATPYEQANNLRTTLRFTCFGLDATISEWADIFGVSRNVIVLRVRRNPTKEFSSIIEGVIKKYGKSEKLHAILSA